ICASFFDTARRTTEHSPQASVHYKVRGLVGDQVKGVYFVETPSTHTSVVGTTNLELKAYTHINAILYTSIAFLPLREIPPDTSW
ncbi:hypothetical protein M5D96_000482, partial [Drosophila gunungcola]